MSADTLMHLARDSAGVLYVLAAMLFVALPIIVERVLFLRRVAAGGRSALDQLDRLDHLDHTALAALAARHRGLPVERVLAAAPRPGGPPPHPQTLRAALRER